MFLNIGILQKENRATTIIAEEVKIKGSLFTPGSIQIDGKVDGRINSEQIIIISRNGKVKGNIETLDIIIEGLFEGEIIARGKVEITSTGKLIGNIIQADTQLIIERGGMFKGKSLTYQKEDILEKDKK